MKEEDEVEEDQQTHCEAPHWCVHPKVTEGGNTNQRKSEDVRMSQRPGSPATKVAVTENTCENTFVRQGTGVAKD